MNSYLLRWYKLAAGMQPDRDMLNAADNENFNMNVNLSNVAATNKTSTSDSSNKVAAEEPEKKGFFETLTGVFTDSKKADKAVVKSNVEETSAEASGDAVASSEAEGQEKVTDGEKASSTESVDELLIQGDSKSVISDNAEESSGNDSALTAAKTSSSTEGDVLAQLASNDALTEDEPVSANHAKSHRMDTSKHDVNTQVAEVMGEGQQLLGRIEQANQTLSANEQRDDSGKTLPPEILLAQMISQPEAIDAQALEQGVQGGVVTDTSQSLLSMSTELVDVKTISIDELQAIDTKLAQGEALSQQELDVIEGLKNGELVADLSQTELAQFAALPSDVKVALTEHQASHHQSRGAYSAVAATQHAHQLAAQDLKHVAAQANVQTVATPNTANSTMPEALAAASLNPAGQVASTADMSKKVMGAGLAASALRGASDKQDSPEIQHGLAGQIQATASQQGVTAQQQARVDAAQQAQLPLQLTKELANDQVAEKVQMMMSKNLKSLDIRLDPPELGRMQIRMTMNNDLANVHFTVANPQARDLIEQTLPRLREMLAQQGMQLADSSVQQQSSGQQQNSYANTEQGSQGSQGRGFSGQSDENFDADVNLDLNVVSKRDGISFYA